MDDGHEWYEADGDEGGRDAGLFSNARRAFLAQEGLLESSTPPSLGECSSEGLSRLPSEGPEWLPPDCVAVCTDPSSSPPHGVVYETTIADAEEID